MSAETREWLSYLERKLADVGIDYNMLDDEFITELLVEDFTVNEAVQVIQLKLNNGTLSEQGCRGD